MLDHHQPSAVAVSTAIIMTEVKRYAMAVTAMAGFVGYRTNQTGFTRIRLQMKLMMK
ncbi:hypothetical protein BVRB_024410 [Beta vulgaris subsp. vulgaris]|uniref:Uncharacterized protein n=1 Tax=Beta vulgaris subsp. vulgaris TaxID=3555 RepID=A0A0J8DTN3_BETVV|nr:hypothetical protein BVRB_024410 [Beta vulgaris subsp. vulgaris]